MPSKTPLVRNEFLVSSGDVRTSSELKRNSRQQFSAKISKDKALSPQGNQTLKFREIKPESCIHPPHVDLPFEFGKSCHSMPSVQTEPIENHQPSQLGMNDGFIDGELIRYMSSLPGYLQRGNNPQDKVLNFGVLDWEHLEKWKHKQNRIFSRGGASASSSWAGSISSMSTNVSSVASNKVNSQGLGSRKKEPADSGESLSGNVDPSQRVQAHNRKVMSTHDSSKYQRSCLGEQPTNTGKDKFLGGNISDVKFPKKKAGNSNEIYKNMQMETSSSELTSNVDSFYLREKTGVLDDKLEERAENFGGLSYDPAHGHYHSKQDSIFLLLPKDFSKSGSPDGSQRTSCDANSSELKSFSDVFSIEELCLEESVPDILHSSPLPFMEENKTDLDLILEKLVHAQRMPFLSDQQSLSCLLNHKVPFQDEAELKKEESNGSTTLDTYLGLESCELKPSKTRDPSPSHHGIGRLIRSFSSKESSFLPRLSYSSIKSGHARVPALDGHDSSTGNTESATTGRARSIPLRKLLDRLLKPKASKNPSIEKWNNLSIKMINDGENDQNGKSALSTTVNAILYLTIKNGVPLFNFLVESRNEILASSVKRLSAMRRDDPSWLYSFYSVQKTKRKINSWKYQGSKGRCSEFYTVIGQLKVNEPHLPASMCEDSDFKEKFTTTKESVLYGVDLSKVDSADTEFMTNKELGAIVIQNSKCISSDDEGGKYEDNTEENITGHIVAILPSGIHSLPNEGGPSTLINRWRSGGSCDCGGWDVGCKLQILTNNDREEESKISRPSRAYTDRHDCSLFLQGPPSKQNNHPVFRLIPHGAGAVYSIEYHEAISSLQAFAIAVAVLSSRDQPRDISDSINSHHDEARKGHCRLKSAIFQGEGTAKYARNPPLSPVGRA